MPNNAEFLVPVLALVAWTLVMWAWMYATRIPAMRAAGIDPQEAAYCDALAQRLPPRCAGWPTTTTTCTSSRRSSTRSCSWPR